MDNLFSLVFPPECVFCGNFGAFVCLGCLNSCRKVCRFDKIPILETTHSLNVFSYFVYEKKIRDCIRQAKYSQKRFSALKDVSKFALRDMLRREVQFPLGLVIPIPLSAKKKKYRGFNQAEIIAAVFSKAYGLNLETKVLERSHDTSAQHRLDRQERLRNLEGAFGVKKDLRGESLILVDDICTTGATLIEAAQELYKAGASQVSAFTLSSQPKIYGKNTNGL